MINNLLGHLFTVVQAFGKHSLIFPVKSISLNFPLKTPSNLKYSLNLFCHSKKTSWKENYRYRQFATLKMYHDDQHIIKKTL